jgi:intermediate peptidase
VGRWRSTEELINNILTAPPGLETITLLDEISDTVCRVVDAAELCRNTHPQRPFVLAANDSYLKLHTYLAV